MGHQSCGDSWPFQRGWQALFVGLPLENAKPRSKVFWTQARLSHMRRVSCCFVFGRYGHKRCMSISSMLCWFQLALCWFSLSHGHRNHFPPSVFQDFCEIPLSKWAFLSCYDLIAFAVGSFGPGWVRRLAFGDETCGWMGWAGLGWAGLGWGGVGWGGVGWGGVGCGGVGPRSKKEDIRSLAMAHLAINDTAIGVLFRLVWLKIDGTGLDGVYSIFQGHLFFQKATYGYCSWHGTLRSKLELGQGDDPGSICRWF